MPEPHDQNIDTIAFGLVAGTLALLAADLIERLAPTPAARIALLDELRDQALRNVENAVGESLSIDQEADAVGRARRHLKHFFDVWRGVAEDEDGGVAR